MSDENIEEKIRKAKSKGDLFFIVGMTSVGIPLLIFALWIGAPWWFTLFAIVFWIILIGWGCVATRNTIEQILRNRKDC